MFAPSDQHRLFGLPPGVDFPRALIDGLEARLHGADAEARARVQLIVNTRRMARRIRDLYDSGPARLLPRISLVTDLVQPFGLWDLPEAVPPLRRRLELTQLIARLLDQQPDLAPRAALYDLADSLAGLMDEMQGEGVSPDVISQLDISDQSGHWARILAFLGIVRHYFDDSSDAPDPEARQRSAVLRLIERWEQNPPAHPVIVAGSTGSRGTTLLLMQAVARLPQGAVVLPGFDFEMPPETWAAMSASDKAMPIEDHPQFRFHRLMQVLDLGRADIAPWHDQPAPNPARNRLMSLALRPVPVTDQWLRDGPTLGPLAPATDTMTLVEAPSTRIEALTIALRLRDAAENGVTAALITPDRTLTRQVSAALDRWNIRPDDSAGQPLHLSPPGRFLRHVADLFRAPLTAEHLLTLLKHPLTHTGGRRGAHLRLTRELELHLRREALPYPGADDFNAWAAAEKDPFAPEWAAWLAACFAGQQLEGDMSLSDLVTRHLALAEHIANGATPEHVSELWLKAAGREASDTVQNLSEHAPHGGMISSQDYAALFHAILSQNEVRNPEEVHPGILIWGTLEARVQGADLVILAGLNEGSWPSAPSPDPWLNRALRHQAGLLLPERRIGLSAHDFQQAIGAKEVWLTRSVRSDDAETVPSRWLNRLTNLMDGLSGQDGPQALKAMRGRGQHWQDLARALETPPQADPAPRPAPCPPADVRPRQLSVTEIKRLIRDPYAIYAKHVLRLRPLDPLMRAPDALLRGIVLHGVLEQFIKESAEAPEKCTRERLMQIALDHLTEHVPWAETRATWLARLERVADWFVETERARRAIARPAGYEAGGQANLSRLGFTLTAKADRIDIDANGQMHIYDYKTGAPPSKDEQTYFDKQLLLEAIIAEQAGFGELPPSPVARAVFIGLTSDPKEIEAPLADEPPAKVWAEFEELIAAYLDPAMGFTSRRAMKSKKDAGDYDQLARFGEWDITTDPNKERVG
ncbi:double-strand break repair protein AddB [Roseovarius faecimaris]|uniref:Double-strand break repair protein AddB n=1 Tax=Roseovarius faecimaris TaxID=2494550 RepID=A0A6I6IX38_9RHOB|nr:double-strand break repair protein AddB [Roseovarius faecimaris]QGY00162.1 double-strand break repair protein AddB [Roseovarius faecimaris]